MNVNSYIKNLSDSIFLRYGYRPVSIKPIIGFGYFAVQSFSGSITRYFYPDEKVVSSIDSENRDFGKSFFWGSYSVSWRSGSNFLPAYKIKLAISADVCDSVSVNSVITRSLSLDYFNNEQDITTIRFPVPIQNAQSLTYISPNNHENRFLFSGLKFVGTNSDGTIDYSVTFSFNGYRLFFR